MQYLTFSLNDSIYAVPVLQVREVLGYTTPQELPCADPVIAGLIRSRDQSISVLNLRRKFDFPDTEISKETRIIVIEIDSISEYSNSQGQIVFGAIVDNVNEVIDIDASMKEPSPEVGNSTKSFTAFRCQSQVRPYGGLNNFVSFGNFRTLSIYSAVLTLQPFIWL